MLPRVSLTPTIGATVLATAVGLIFSLFIPPASQADDPPPSTVPSLTVPTPDPAPPKPKPNPAPPLVQVSYTPAVHQAPKAPAPSTRPAATAKPMVRTPVKRKPNTLRHKKGPVKKKTSVLPKVTVASLIGAVNVKHAFQTKPSGSLNPGSLLIVLGLVIAITCFTIALVPATSVKWRPAAIFLSERQVDVTVVGLVLLVAAACTLFWTNTP